jgi:GntR family transcriptional regulator, transcriptional repressor for pyruvate dehydrogenase complex
MAADSKPSQKRYEILADQLRQRIMSGEFAEGSVLPGERELVLQTRGSRSSIREALRILEADGLLSTKTAGRYGGSIVQRPPAHTLRRQLELFIKGRSISFEDLLRTRQAIEPMLAGLAATNRTASDLSDIRHTMLELETAFSNDRDRITLLNSNWHLAVAKAAHNDLLNALMIGISGALRQASAVQKYGTEENAEGMMKAHRRIFEAISRQDAPAAKRRMERHLNAYEQDMAVYVPSQLDIS